MAALYVQPWEEERVMMKEVKQGKSEEQEEGGTEASSPTGSTTDEETDEDSEPEPPPVIRRKVSFADAFGLNLVSVKEFDNVEVTEPEVSLPPEMEATRPLEEFYMSCLFTVPSSPEELDQRLQTQMVELESIELLPGTTTIRGTIRVVNLCYSKSVYARMSLDRWTSYFDLLAEYVPGSSDRKTDRFTFKYTLVPPFEMEGTRVEICLRYDTPGGTFWANNKDMNYVLFCHQKTHVNEPQVPEESSSHRSKRSCLKANRRGSADEKTRETSYTSTVVAGATDKAEEADRKTTGSAEIQSLLYHKEDKPLVDSIKRRHRAARSDHVQDYLFQRRQHVPKAYSHDSANGQNVSQPLPTPCGGSASFVQKHQKKPSNESQQVLTYHQIPLLTLDWNNDKAHQWETVDMDDIWTGRAKMTLSKAENIEDTPSVNDMWETFLNGTDDTTDKETSVCDVWQAFLNGPSCTDHSGVPESEWLQTAALVSPSNDKEPKNQNAASSQEHEFQVGADTPTTLHAACQLLSDTCETSLANVALKAADHQPAEACVSSPRDDNTETQDASQRSETNSVTDTPQEFSLEGATPVSEGSVDSSTVCHKHSMWEQEREGIIGGAEGIGGDEPFTPHTADLVTSSGELETTDMTAMPESQNASAVDRISQGAMLDEGLSSSREGQGTGTVHNATDDMLAFRETIRQGTKDGERFVFSTSRQGAEEGIVNNCTENKVSRGEEIFRPQKTEGCEISQRYADEKQRESFRLNRNSENPLQENESDENETRTAQSHADEFNTNQTCEDNFKQSQIMASKFKLEESEDEDVASNNVDLEALEKTEVEPSYCTTSEETKRLIDVEAETTHVLNEEALKLNSSWQWEKTSIISEAHKQSKPAQAGAELCIQKEEEYSKLTQIQENVGLKSETDEHVQTEEEKSLSCDGIIEEQQEINPRITVESREMKTVFQKDHDTFRPFPTDKCNPNPVEEIGMRWTHLPDNTRGQKEDVGHEVMAKDYIVKKHTSMEHQPETFKMVFKRDHDMFRPFSTDKHNPNPVEEVEMRWTHSQDNLKGRKEDAGHEISPEEVMAKERIAKKELQHHPKTLKKVFQRDRDTFRPFPTDKCNPNPMEEVEVRLAHSQDDMKGHKEDVGHEISPEEVTAKERAAKKDTSMELQRQPEILERIEEDMSQRDKDERVSIEKLKIEALGELMGNVGIPQGERKNAPAELKEQELSAEVESSPHVECKKLSEGTKDPITVENTGALEVMEEMFIERFGENLVRGVWEEVFNLKAQASDRDTNIVDGMRDKLADVPDITQDCHLLFEKDFDDAFDSGVYSLTEFPSDPNSSLCEGLEQMLAVKSNEYSAKERSQPLTTTEQTHCLSEFQTDSNSSAQSRQSLTESAQSSPNDQENYSQIKERSVTRKETGRQIEQCAVIHKESFNRSDHQSHKHLSSFSEKLRESDGLTWWSVLYILSHITRLLICTVLVAGFFFIVFLYDFPTFSALYVFSMCWWFYKWKTHRVMTTDKGMVG